MLQIEILRDVVGTSGYHCEVLRSFSMERIEEGNKYASKSWTDYLHVKVGGTLSNVEINEQACRHGPQINNIYELQVVTVVSLESLLKELIYIWTENHAGTGQVVTCSEEMTGKTVICLEIANYYKQEDAETIVQIIETLLLKLNYNESTMFISEVSYLDFLDRVHVSELKLQEKGLWDVPHPWLNLLVHKSKIRMHANEVFSTTIFALSPKCLHFYQMLIN
uniref:Cytokinin dehydrogenase 1-like n=1 Tax=Tanacetum cinerariifolium TaxID=118510 RepID=A0A699GZT6_TANCI|nr:cytokinin dehydrogenase 1-like [Tanacetum cinerariifolium]